METSTTEDDVASTTTRDTTKATTAVTTNQQLYRGTNSRISKPRAYSTNNVLQASFSFDANQKTMLEIATNVDQRAEVIKCHTRQPQNKQVELTPV